ncbi:MAG TPA: TonB-dependent receptor [Methylophilaceae bacterium]|nr:TonB-dependent receptor [Methylophilaceae bacterium]
MKKIVLVSLAGVFVSMQTQAQENNQLNDVVVTATRTPQKISGVLSDVSVIDEEEIRKAGQTSLVELLKMQPGIEMSQSGGIGKSSSVFIRGANATHTLVLIDGMRVSSATTGTTSLENIPLAQIERIEILRGPASSLYGADAICGVIQIFTKSAKGAPRFNASVGRGSYNTSLADAGVSGRINDTSFSLQAGIIETDGVSSIANKTLATYNRDHDGYRNQNLSAKLAQHFSERHELGLTAFISDGKNFFDGGARTPAARPRNLFDFYSTQTQTAYGIYSKNRFTDNWLSTLRAGQSVDDLTSFSPNTANTLKLKSVFKTTQNQYSWQNDITTKIGLITLGVERLEQQVDSTTNFAVTQRDIQSWLAGWQTVFGNNSLQLNARNDDNSQFGNHTTGAVSYGYQFNPQWRASAGFGTAFNAPTFNQLYSPLTSTGTGTFIGNPNLKPEEARNKEIGLHYDNGVHRVGAVYYRNNVTDLIVNTGSPNLVPTNVSEALLTGLTLAYQGTLAGLRVGASADFQRPEDEATGNLLPRRAKQHSTLSVAKTIGDWEIGSLIEGSSSRFNDAANTVEMSGYTLVNVYTNYKINNDWSLNARINNLFDRDYELAKDFGTLGTNLLVTLRYAPQP